RELPRAQPVLDPFGAGRLVLELRRQPLRVECDARRVGVACALAPAHHRELAGAEPLLLETVAGAGQQQLPPAPGGRRVVGPEPEHLAESRLQPFAAVAA